MNCNKKMFCKMIKEQKLTGLFNLSCSSNKPGLLEGYVRWQSTERRLKKKYKK